MNVTRRSYQVQLATETMKYNLVPKYDNVYLPYKKSITRSYCAVFGLVIASDSGSDALVICNHGPPEVGGGDSRGKVLCFYFSIVPAVPRIYQGFVLYRQYGSAMKTTHYRGKGLWFYQLPPSPVSPQ